MKKTFLFSLAIGALMFGACCRDKDTAAPAGAKSGDATNPSEVSGPGKAGSLARFAITDGKLYTVDNNTLRVFNISNPGSPSFTTSANAGLNVETIYSHGRYLFVASQEGMVVFDAQTNARVPERVEHVRSYDPVVANDNYAYISLRAMPGRQGANEVQVFDIRDIQRMNRTANVPMMGPRGMGLDGNNLFVCDDGLKVYDVSQGDKLELKAQLDIVARDVIPAKSSLIVVGHDGVYQYSYKDNEATQLSKISLNRNQ